MHISKKQAAPHKTVTGKSYGKPVAVDWKQFVVDVDATLPYGKHIGKTVAWLQKNDEGYWSWLISQSLLGQWGLIRVREVEKPRTYTADDSSRWVALQECPGIGRVCPQSWLQ